MSATSSMVALRACLLLSLFSIGALIPARSMAEEPSAKVILVLDASGSMWGQIEGRTKIEIAREAVRDLLQDWDPNIQLGLSVYGHRRKGDCTDIEMLIPVGEADPDEVIKAVDAIKPKGKTPLSQAVRLAAEALRYTEEQATVVLVSDGKETCGLDPCAIGKELEENGVEFTAHVIGFDIKKEEEAQLRCLAENTGGLFLAATDAQTLKEAVGQAVEVVKAAAPPGIKFKAVLTEGGEPLKENLEWEIVEAEADDQGRHARVASSFKAVPVFSLPEGRYLARVETGAARGSLEFEAQPEESAEHAVVLNAGYARLRATLHEGGEPLDQDQDVEWNVYEPEADEQGRRERITFFFGAKPFFTLAAGRYRVVAKSGTAVAGRDIEVKAGEVTEETVNLAAGYARLSAVLAEGGDKVTRDLEWNVYQPEADLRGQRKSVAFSYEAEPTFTLSAGHYRVVAKTGAAAAEEDIEVAEGQLVEHAISLNAGYARLSVVKEGKPVAGDLSWEIYEAETDVLGERKLVTFSYKAEPVFTLPVGEYLAKVTSPAGAGSLQIKVEAAQLADYTVTISD